PFAQTRAVENHGISPEKVIELDVTYGRQLREPADQVLIRGNGQCLDASGRAKLGDAPANAVRRRREGDDHGAHAETPNPQGQLVDRSQYADVAQQTPLFGGVVIEQSDDAPLAAVAQLPGEPRRCL